MATWGPSKKRERTRALPPSRNTTPARASSSTGSSRSSSGGGSATRNVTRARYSKPEDDGSRRNRRADITGEFRRAIAGREHEFVGLLLIVGGIIFAAGVYF